MDEKWRTKDPTRGKWGTEDVTMKVIAPPSIGEALINNLHWSAVLLQLGMRKFRQVRTAGKSSQKSARLQGHF
jgi:hypothetical protein